ncbi:MAG: pyridoxal 5'-phosphate synthase glutaminase subunit PdxT [Dehalococcoidia bacterium]
MMRIGVLALQGDFVEHEAAQRRLGVDTHQVRRPQDLSGLDALVIPGGESTTLCRLMIEFELQEPLKRLIAGRLPVWGTCAGLILLAKRARDLPYPTLDALDISVRRNAYGRQLDSFEADIDVPALGQLSRNGGKQRASSPAPFHAVFIRAPVVDGIGDGVEVLAQLSPIEAGPRGGSVVAVRQDNLLATTFHPELTGDSRFHRYFLEIVQAHTGRRSSAK